MVQTSIGPSTDPTTRNARMDVPPMGEVASFRYNNPGAQYPSAEAAKFGQIGYGIIGGGHKIARFPSQVNGAASNFELLHRSYTGMTIYEAGKRWTGSHDVGVLGYNPHDILTEKMVIDSKTAIPLLKALAHRESGKGNNLSELQWQQAHRMFLLGSADNFFADLGNRPDPVSETSVAETDGAALVALARKHIGEDYRNVLVPKDDDSWVGPWDCAEFVSWLIYQHAGFLYGCTDNEGNPRTTEAYTGAWKDDVLARGVKVSVEEAASTVGGVLLRYPPQPGKMGHIALSDGIGGTIEARSQRAGVVADTVQGRTWHTGVLIPGLTYAKIDGLNLSRPAFIYRIGETNMSSDVVRRIQSALNGRGYDPGLHDGEFGPNTEAAVIAFQEAMGLVVDGEVGPETAAAMGISLDTLGAASQSPSTDPILHTVPELSGDRVPGDTWAAFQPILLTLLVKDRNMTDGPFADSDAAKFSALLVLFQALASGKPIETESILRSLFPNGSTESIASGTSDPQSLLVTLLLRRLFGEEVGDGKSDIGPVNGALGKTVGKLLNGYKSTIGIIGSVLTGTLGSSSGSGVLNDIASSIPALAGSSNIFLPLFLGMAAWGFLGKLEKWNQ